MKRLFFACIAAVILSVIASPSAFAIAYNLTTAGAVANDGGVWFVQVPPQATGTGLIDSFVQIGQGGGSATTEQAYNTTVNGVFDNGGSDNFNHSITLGSIPIVVNPGGGIAAGSYYQFLLDIGEPQSAGGDQFVSLDNIRLYAGGTANPSTTNLTDPLLGTLVYTLDSAGGTDDWVALNADLNPGQGAGDMFMYVPIAVFAGQGAGSIVTLFSAFGGQGNFAGGGGIPAGQYGATGAFEEWATLPATSVPEPASLSLILMGLAGIGSAVWLRTKK